MVKKVVHVFKLRISQAHLNTENYEAHPLALVTISVEFQLVSSVYFNFKF